MTDANAGAELSVNQAEHFGESGNSPPTTGGDGAMCHLPPASSNGATRRPRPHTHELEKLTAKWRAEADQLRALEPRGQAAAFEQAAQDLELAIALGRFGPPATFEGTDTGAGRILATELFDMGYEDLVSVAPPDTYVVTRGTIIPNSRGKTPGRPSDSRWFTYDWDRPHGRDLAHEIDASGANMGLRGRNFPGLNLNTDDPDVTLAVLRIAEDVLGSAPHRMSRATRRLLMYRTDQPFAGRRATVTHKDKTHRVELLADGQQYVRVGRHHGGAGARYGWSRIWRPEELTRITEADAARFFEALEEQLGGAGFSVYVGSVGSLPDSPDATAQATTQAPFFEESGTSPPPDDEATEVSHESGKEGSDA
jgi:hypothetical protein